MNILGISAFYHDSAACLIRDGHVVMAVEEERLSRRKHDNRFPRQAAAACLQAAGIPQPDLVAFYEKPLRKLERVASMARQHPFAVPGHFAEALQGVVQGGLAIKSDLEQALGYRGEIVFCDHHQSHAASSFFPSGFDEAAIIVVDGVGEWATTSVHVGRGSTIHPMKEIRYPDSLGMLYSALTAYLGFKVNDDEYKVMGLASYGEPKFLSQMDALIENFEDGSFKLNLKYFSFVNDRTSMFSAALEELLGPPRARTEPITQRHMDIAASLQAKAEQVLLNLARAVRAETGLSSLCLAGGVGYNCVANARIRTEAGFDRFFVQPAAGDSGAAIGAALLAHHAAGAKRPTSSPGSSPGAGRRYDTCLGPAYQADDIRKALADFDVDYAEYDTDTLLDLTSGFILDDLIVGWFQGAAEFGPRALGRRSILANPQNPDMMDILNARVKFREDFRPFAPAVAAEAAIRFFRMEGESPYMLLTVPVREDCKAAVPSIVHVDGSARVQTVHADSDPLFHRLLETIGRKSGIPMSINTSFNIRGEPIVCSPADAVRCFLNTDIDVLVIGNFIVHKR